MIFGKKKVIAVFRSVKIEFNFILDIGRAISFTMEKFAVTPSKFSCESSNGVLEIDSLLSESGIVNTLLFNDTIY
jgi:hypothetical protein